jgi:hypothetical protein
VQLTSYYFHAADPGIAQGSAGEIYDIWLRKDSECAEDLQCFNRPSENDDLVDSIESCGRA